MLQRHAERFPGECIPQPHGPVGAGRRQEFPVAAESHGVQTNP